ncbi:MAG: membrane integrity-associated transporter subunit PqiC [Verrucomicrobiales bacterium]|nr:membrane integrity-associated transporter subunit PqiC [Verrucomicrobiales bacterium]
MRLRFLSLAGSHLPPPRAAWWGMLLLAAGLTGCLGLKPSVDATRFYVLTATAETGAVVAGETVTLGRVDLPDYIRTPRMAIRASANEIVYSDLHQWAEPLEDAVPRVIEENLLRQLGSQRFRSGPAPAHLVAHEIQLEILRFDLEPAGFAVVEAVGRRVHHETRELEWQQPLSYRIPFHYDPTSLAPAASALSEALAQLTLGVSPHY